MVRARSFAVVVLVAVPALVVCAEGDLELGRNEDRVLSGPVPMPIGQGVLESRLLERLQRREYRRVHSKPTEPGEFFFGHTIFWIFRPSYRVGGREHEPLLFGLDIDAAGTITSVVDRERDPIDTDSAFLRPLVLAESLEADRAPRIAIRLGELPEHVWRAVLAAEDHRFFDHHGLDGRAIARAMLKNVQRGEVSEGGSTITQQLVKNRDLSPKRTVGRKASEAIRALSLEADFTKEEILEAYLNTVYMGHESGVGIYGIGAAAPVYFSTTAGELGLGQAAALAALVQGPNRLHPVRHGDRLLDRRNWVIGRMEEFGWVDGSAARFAKGSPLGVLSTEPPGSDARAFVRWVGEIAADEAPKRAKKGRGVVAETNLDPLLQAHAASTVEQGLRRLRASRHGESASQLQAALIAIDGQTGDVLAYVAADPARSDAFDRIRSGRRQPGSLVKPLVLLEALEDCGSRKPLHLATRVADRPITLDLPSGRWSPQNPDGRFHGIVDVRDALSRSLNVPFVNIAGYCGFETVADRVRKAGLPMPKDLPPSFVLGAVEASPVEIVGAFTVLSTPGSTLQPRPVLRLSRPGGRGIERFKVRRKRVVPLETAYLVAWALEQAVEHGTAAVAEIPGVTVAAKTGTSSGGRDAWLVGQAGSVVAAVWVGRDDSRPAGLSGAASAGPIWRAFMEVAARARPLRAVGRPAGIIEAHVDPDTGLRVKASRDGARTCLFRKGAKPRRNRPILRDRPTEIVEGPWSAIPPNPPPDT